MERGSYTTSNSKNSNGLPFLGLPIPAETDPYPNRIRLCLPTEPAKLRMFERFSLAEIRTETDPRIEFRKAGHLQ